MKTIGITIALASSLLVSKAQTIFHDTFANGSTLNSPTQVDPTGHSTSYDLMSSKVYSPTNPTISSGSLRFGIAATGAGHIELQALFTNSAIALATNGDYVELIVTFVAATNILNQGQAWGFGVYNSGFPQSPPVAGGLNGVAVSTTTTNATGGAQLWQGYWAQVFGTNAGSSRIVTRPAQTGAGATGDNNQDLVTTGSGSQSYGNPGATAVGTNAVPSQVSIIQGNTYTEDFYIGWYATNSLVISNSLYSGSTVNPANLVPTSQFIGVATNATFLTAGFDSFAIGWRATDNTKASLMDISSITINSINSAPTTPTISSQPISASAPIGGSVPFTVSAQGINLIYQWKRGGTNVNSPNLSVTSGANSSTLLVSPITTADLASYSCTIRGAGNLTVDSSTVSLSQRTPVNLVWSGNSTYWDLTNSVSWLNGATASVWNYGDNVTFDDTSSLVSVNLSNFLSAGTVTVTGNNNYKFRNDASGGTIAGTAKLIYNTSVQLNIANANTYSGGTLINAAGRLFLGNQSALGTGPVTNALAGGVIEYSTAGSATSGIGDLVVNDDLTLQPDTNSTFSVVVLGNLRGVAGKTLTYNPLNPGGGVNTRMRVYGTNTSFDCNIVLNGDNSGAATNALFGGTELAFYNNAGTQVYNGAISGVGGVISRDSGTEAILNSADNSYSGGTTPTAGAIGVGANTALGTGPIFVGTEVGSGNGTGTIFAYGAARTVGNPIIYSTNNQTLQFGGTNALTLTGAIDLRSADFPATPTNRTFSSSNTTALATLAGVISAGSTACGIIKTGNGALALTAAETYTGPTLVTNSAGRLLINGSTAAASAVTAATNGNIGGIGTITGNLTIAQGGTLAPGDYAAIGTLNVGGNLVNNGNISVRVNRAGSLSDNTAVAGTLTSSGSGTVTVTNLGADLQIGDTFTLFNHALTGAGTLNVKGAGAIWSNKLAIDGTIAVTALVASNPGPLNFSASGGNLNLSWPANYQTWILQSNSTSLASTNWFPVANSSNVTSLSLPIQPNRANVFYRLVAP